jgi:hypothetical protein
MPEVIEECLKVPGVDCCQKKVKVRVKVKCMGGSQRLAFFKREKREARHEERGEQDKQRAAQGNGELFVGLNS